VNDGDKRGKPAKSCESRKWQVPGSKKRHVQSKQPPVPETDTGRGVEDTKANGRTLVKELGKMAP
jgi:hypothetical protein